MLSGFCITEEIDCLGNCLFCHVAIKPIQSDTHEHILYMETGYDLFRTSLKCNYFSVAFLHIMIIVIFYAGMCQCVYIII